MTVNTGAGQHQAVINVTPMIDVLLVLLIIFMAIAPIPQAGLDAVVPQNVSGPVDPKPELPVLLEIAGDGSYRLNSQALAPSSRHDRLMTVFARRQERVLFVKGADTLEYSTVAAAIDTAHGARIDRVALMPR
jgi:biopolymer transport protein TolR